MIVIRRILCPSDLSTESDEALRYALALARAYKAKLTLLYCRRPSSTAEWINGVRARKLFESSLFNLLDANQLKALDWEGVVTESDDVGRTIADEAAKRQCELIVMRSRRRPHAAALLGSTAETVARHAPCPVLVTHPSEREWVGLSTGEIDLKRVLVTHDFSAESELALNYGLSLAQEYRTELHLLHVLDQEEEDPPEFAWAHVDIESRYKDAAGRLQGAVPKEPFLWCNVINVVRWGNAAEEIVAYARESQIDLICIGARGSGFDLNKLFGSTTEHVLRRAECPVLVARSVAVKATSAKAA